ncbi:MAG TPA: sigma-70 family RNA polymerase sigma factor [Chitinophagaceae bacterium]|nr:sigma-70 family RNA polymerase sigma factor [Chitinophagaceae bacterium]
MNKEQNLDDIVNRCKAGNRQAQEKLYRNFYRVMMSLCLRYTKNETDAMEVLNTGFYKVYNNIHRFDSSRASIYTWIRTIIINSCLDYIKSKQKIIQQVTLDEIAGVQIDPDIISKMKSEHLLHLVRKLSPATQAVFNLFIIEGYTHKEIGELLHISEGTSKWHLSEARKNLQSMINEENIN